MRLAPGTEKKAVQAVYAIEAGGLTGTLTEWAAPPGKSRVEMVLGPLKQTDADDGKTAWQQDATGNVRVLRGPELAQSRADQSLSVDMNDPLAGHGHGRITLRPQREAGTGFFVIDVAPDGGTLQTVYLDPQTYLVRKMVAAKGGISGTVEILAYTWAAGQHIPSRLRIGYAGLPLTVTANLTQARLLSSPDPALFRVPVSVSDFAFLTSGAHTATIPFTDDHNEIVVPVTVNGHARQFLLDSGAGSSFITAQAAQQVGLTAQGDLPAVGYGGLASSGIATQAALEVPGAVRLAGQSLYVLKDPHLAQTLTERGGVDGGLGYDLLARFVVTIDYAARTLTLTDPAVYAPPAGAVTLPLSLTNHVPTLAARVDGKAVGQFTVDTGDSGAIHLFNSYARANGLDANAHAPGAQTVSGAGIGGVLAEVLTPGHTLTLGTAKVTGLSVATVAGGGVSDISQQAGGLGNGVLSRFRVTLDYPHGRLVLLPASSMIVPTDTTASLPLTTESVLAHHLAALGGEAAVAAIRSTRMTQTVTTGGLTGTVVTVYAAPDKEWEADDLGLLHTQDGYDGHSAWRRDSNGNTRLLGDDERRELRLQLYLDTNSYVLSHRDLPDGGIPGKVTLRPQTEPGTGDLILDVAPEDGKPCVLFLDPKTYLIAREQHLDDNVLVTTTCEDYRAVDGVQFPFRQRTSNGEARYDVLSQVTKLENNVAVPDSLFAPPAAAAAHRALFLKPGATSATVPFDFADGEISVPVHLNGQAARVFLDSGASGFALSKTTADALHLAQQGTLEARGYGGSTDLHPVKIDTVDIGDAARLSDLTAVAVVLPEGFDDGLAHPVAGFLGYDLLSQFVVKIDFAHQTLTLTAPNAFTPTPADGTPLPLNLDDDIPSLTAQFDDLPPARFQLDTGDEGVLRLYGPYVAANGLRARYPKFVPSIGGGIGGVSRSDVSRTHAFTVAGVTLSGLPTEFSLDAKGGASQLLAGSLGARLLSRFTVTFDYPHQRVFFAPNAQTAQPFDTRTYGVLLASYADKGSKTHVVVADIAPGTPALKDGLALGQEVVRLDGQPIAAVGLLEARRRLSLAGGHFAHTLTVAAPKGTRTVTLTVFDPLS